MQIYLVLAEIKKKTENQQEIKENEKKPPKHFKDVLTRLGLTNFFINYLKEMKNESISIQVSPEVMALLDSFKISIGELNKLNE